MTDENGAADAQPPPTDFRELLRAHRTDGTPHKRISEWMRQAGQQVPPQPSMLDAPVAELRINLQREEQAELIDALETLQATYSETALLGVLKEAADVLVVTYGLLAAIGVDGDEVYNIIMDGNDDKLEGGFRRDDGKVMVSPVQKRRIKRITEKRLRALI